MPGAANLEEDLVLTLEQDLAIIKTARQVHEAKGPDKQVAIKARGQLDRRGCGWLRLGWRYQSLIITQMPRQRSKPEKELGPLRLTGQIVPLGWSLGAIRTILG